jgi:hypothetical protein
MLTALPVASKLCSTCVFWGGAREINSRGFIKIHPYSRGECRGKGFKHLSMAALAACDDWELLTITEPGHTEGKLMKLTAHI